MCWIKLGSRMRIRVRFLETFDGYVRVDLCRGKTGVAEQRLHAAQIRAAIEHVRGEAVAQFVWAHGNRNGRPPNIPFQHQPN